MRKLFSDEQIQRATDKLKISLPDKDVNNGTLFRIFCSTTITNDFTAKSLKRITVEKTSFVDCNFNNVAATGSKFSNTKFENCDFSGSNFQYCHFYKVCFSNTSLIKGANFSHSVFIDCKFTNVTIIESTLYDCYFEDCTISNSIIRTNTFENSTLRNCLLNEIDLSCVNLEYMKFDGIKMHNVLLPPYQIPYIIGATSYMNKSKDSVFIYTDNKEITCKEYCNMYDDLAAYFLGQKSYFPLANILIAKGKHHDAFEYIEYGIEEACDYFDFRMIKHYCRLACSNEEFTHIQLKSLYDLVTKLSYNNTWDITTLHSYMLNIGEIKEILLNNSENKNRVEFVIKTNIDKEDLSSINFLYNRINGIIKENCSTTHVDTIELRHNSPYELYVTCIDALPNILVFVSAMYSIFAAGNKGLEFFKNVEETIRVHQQNRLHKYELEEKSLDIEIKKEELRQMKSKKSVHIASVLELEHILKCNSIEMAQKITPEYLHYKITNIPE